MGGGIRGGGVSVEHVELVVLFLLVAVAALTALARRPRRALPDPARDRRQPRRLRARRAGRRARAGPRPAHLPAAAAVQRGVLLVAARPARATRGRSRSTRSGSCWSRCAPSPSSPTPRSTGCRGRRRSRSARSSRRPTRSPRSRSRAGSACRAGCVSVIEGESLINDGTALVAYRTAVAAAVGGTFSLLDATRRLRPQRRRRRSRSAWSSRSSLIVGLPKRVARRRRRGRDLARRRLRGYLPAEELGVSGVLAAVDGRPDRRPPLARAVDAGLAAARLRVLGGARVPAQRGAVRPRRAAAAGDPRRPGALRARR